MLLLLPIEIFFYILSFLSERELLLLSPVSTLFLTLPKKPRPGSAMTLLRENNDLSALQILPLFFSEELLLLTLWKRSKPLLSSFIHHQPLPISYLWLLPPDHYFWDDYTVEAMSDQSHLKKEMGLVEEFLLARGYWGRFPKAVKEAMENGRLDEERYEKFLTRNHGGLVGFNVFNVVDEIKIAVYRFLSLLRKGEMRGFLGEDFFKLSNLFHEFRKYPSRHDESPRTVGRFLENYVRIFKRVGMMVERHQLRDMYERERVEGFLDHLKIFAKTEEEIMGKSAAVFLRKIISEEDKGKRIDMITSV